MRVFVSATREAGVDDPRRLARDLEQALGAGSAVGASADGEQAVEGLERADLLVAAIGPGWRGAQDGFAAEVERAFARSLPVCVIALRRPALPTRDQVPDPLKPLLDIYPRLRVEVPSDFYWDVTVAQLTRWLAAIGQETERIEATRARAAEGRRRLDRELERARAQVVEAEAAVAAAERRVAALAHEHSAADQLVAAREIQVDPGRVGAGLRIYISYRPETGGDVRTLERDLRERIERASLASTEAVPETADPAEHARERIARADVVLAAIGPGWLEGSDGVRHIDDAGDPIRLELEAALARPIPVIPVLTQRSARPTAERLPESLQALAGEQSYELLVAFWEDGVRDLVARLAAIEGDLLARERGLDEAIAAQRRLARDAEDAAAGQVGAVTAARNARERAGALELDVRRADQEEERLRLLRPDQNDAYTAGPGAIELRRERRGGRERLIAFAAAAVVLLIVIIVLVSH